MNKKVLLYLIPVIFLIFAFFESVNYSKNNYDVTGFVFICNRNVCNIKHTKSNGEVKYTEYVDITNIEGFSTRREKIPRTNRVGMVLYADCKDGTSYRFSPIYIRPSSYVEEELIKPLNRQLKKEPISILFKFP